MRAPVRRTGMDMDMDTGMDTGPALKLFPETLCLRLAGELNMALVGSYLSVVVPEM